jgi:hypothetical protein
MKVLNELPCGVKVRERKPRKRIWTKERII